jgi:hypothetical protein
MLRFHRRTSKLYDRTKERLTQDEVDRNQAVMMLQGEALPQRVVRALAGVALILLTGLHGALANPGAYVELQHRLMRQYLDTLIENRVTLVRAVRRTADDTLGPLEQQLHQRRSARHDEGEARQAAE